MPTRNTPNNANSKPGDVPIVPIKPTAPIVRRQARRALKLRRWMRKQQDVDWEARSYADIDELLGDDHSS